MRARTLVIASIAVLAFAILGLPDIRWDNTTIHAEIGAVEKILAIYNAQSQYYSRYGRFAPTLEELGLTAAGQRSDYRFALTATPIGYAIHAAPIRFGLDGGQDVFFR